MLWACGLGEARHGPARPVFFARPAPARDPARQQPRGGILLRGGLRALSRVARRRGGAPWLRHPCLCADDEPRASAGDAAGALEPAAADAGRRPALCPLRQRCLSPDRDLVGGALPRRADRQRRVFPRLLPLYRAQSGARRHGGAGGRLSLVELARACAGRGRCACRRARALSRAGADAGGPAGGLSRALRCAARRGVRDGSAPRPMAAGPWATCASSARSRRRCAGAWRRCPRAGARSRKPTRVS